MVLKALFVESTLHPIQGLDARANEALAHMLCDYAHERWAAGRPVSRMTAPPLLMAESRAATRPAGARSR